MSRASLVALLVAAEVLIAGMAIYVLRGHHFHGGVAFVARAVAPIDAGASPRIAIDDVDSRIVVTPSKDGLVHVSDLTNTGGAFFGETKVQQLNVQRTADGVSISRPATSTGVHLQIFGWSERRVEVQVPSGSHIDIARCAGAGVSGIEGGVAVTSQDGRITLADLRGTVEAKSDDGSVSATHVHGDNIVLQSDDGRLSMTDVSASSLDAQTKDGSIVAERLAIEGDAPRAVLHTADGSIHIALSPRSDLTVQASTDDGKIIVDGKSFQSDSGDSAHQTVKLGSGAGSMQLSSGDGSIHILTNGAV